MDPGGPDLAKNKTRKLKQKVWPFRIVQIGLRGRFYSNRAGIFLRARSVRRQQNRQIGKSGLTIPIQVTAIIEAVRGKQHGQVGKSDRAVAIEVADDVDGIAELHTLGAAGDGCAVRAGGNVGTDIGREVPGGAEDDEDLARAGRGTDHQIIDAVTVQVAATADGGTELAGSEIIGASRYFPFMRDSIALGRVI